MNLGLLLGLVRGSNLYETIVRILTLVAGFVAGIDSDKSGNDDLLAGGLLAVASAVDAYGRQDDNEHGNIVDGIIAGLVEYRKQMVECGKIFPVDYAAKTSR